MTSAQKKKYVLAAHAGRDSILVDQPAKALPFSLGDAPGVYRLNGMDTDAARRHAPAREAATHSEVFERQEHKTRPLGWGWAD